MNPVKPYPITPKRSVPASIERPDYVGKRGGEHYTGSHVQAPEVIEAMRESSQIAANAILVAAAEIAPGVTTDRLDAVAHEYMCDHGAYPSSLEYMGFPKSICTSINDVICHGIPDERPLDDGDVVKIDITAFKNGVHGDNCATFYCGDVADEIKALSENTREAMYRGIRAVKPGRPVSVIGRVIESYAKRFGYGVVRDYTGHGVHTAFHSGLVILHYDEPRLSTPLEVGMTLTIEPMFTLGDYRSHVWDDGWTVQTVDGSWCAQFEQTLVVTPEGSEILTVPSTGELIVGGDPSSIDVSSLG